ncbi:hypothetical protein CE91St46_16620 [Eubacteriales bacterium]|nr:hypothetical protein [Faecalicatena sp. BF-R-105]GKH50551.1 hypothetical protein CE91St46_16620 [Eubacteriales bacterium]GKH63273.1 hypothetical protein CE91St47_17420 [Eubacteriales bacterium]
MRSQLLARQQKERRELTMRLTSPSHITGSRFTEHQKIEGYHEDRSVRGFLGCDRLLKSENLYGMIQLGYDPKRQQSFLFATIKTSIFDTAASREQHEINDRAKMSEMKIGNQNRAYVSRRRKNSAMLLYKAENKPWSESSVAPYLTRANTGALRKVLPFLGVDTELAERGQLLLRARSLMEQSRQAFLTGRTQDQRAIRARQLSLLREQEQVGSLIWRKQQQTRLFFRKANMVFDLQKAAMFQYYRGQADSGRRQEESVPVEPPQDEVR